MKRAVDVVCLLLFCLFICFPGARAVCLNMTLQIPVVADSHIQHFNPIQHTHNLLDNYCTDHMSGRCEAIQTENRELPV